MGLGDFIRTADWKSEKHVPAITAPAKAGKGETFAVEVDVGKGIAHPNTVEHHIAWISLSFVPQGSSVPVEIGRMMFSAHSEAAAAPKALFSMSIAQSGDLYATAYCNIHGLWGSSARIDIA